MFCPSCFFFGRFAVNPWSPASSGVETLEWVLNFLYNGLRSQRKWRPVRHGLAGVVG